VQVHEQASLTVGPCSTACQDYDRTGERAERRALLNTRWPPVLLRRSATSMTKRCTSPTVSLKLRYRRPSSSPRSASASAAAPSGGAGRRRSSRLRPRETHACLACSVCPLL